MVTCAHEAISDLEQGSCLAEINIPDRRVLAAEYYKIIFIMGKRQFDGASRRDGKGKRKKWFDVRITQISACIHSSWSPIATYSTCAYTHLYILIQINKLMGAIAEFQSKRHSER